MSPDPDLWSLLWPGLGSLPPPGSLSATLYPLIPFRHPLPLGSLSATFYLGPSLPSIIPRSLSATHYPLGPSLPLITPWSLSATLYPGSLSATLYLCASLPPLYLLGPSLPSTTPQVPLCYPLPWIFLCHPLPWVPFCHPLPWFLSATHLDLSVLSLGTSIEQGVLWALPTWRWQVRYPKVTPGLDLCTVPPLCPSQSATLKPLQTGFGAPAIWRAPLGAPSSRYSLSLATQTGRRQKQQKSDKKEKQ